MRYKLLGRSGLRVSELALGTMTFGEDWGWGASREESAAIFEAYAEAGGNFVDTACNYTDGTSERFVGELVAPERDRWVVATKYTLSMQRDDPNAGGNGRKNLVRTLEGSLRRLGTDYVDLLWVHMWDGMTPLDEVLRALDDVVSTGKALYVGLSDTPAWVVSRAVELSARHGWAPPVAVQAPYSLSDRAVERELLPMAAELDLAFTPWGVLAGGGLTGKYDTSGDEPTRYDSIGERTRAVARVVGEVAEAVGRPPAQVAIAWLRARRHGCVVVPILGARTAEQMRSNLGALDLELSSDHLAALDAASDFRLGFPRDFLESDDVRELIFGDTYALVDDHRRRAE